jgi:cellulase/cellobiase CelA1
VWIHRPAASEFARVVLSTTTAYAEAHGGTARITNVDSVQASPGHYICSYAVTRPDDAGECHLMQATWTPNGASTYTVTLAGRVHRCRTLREALRSLR